MHKRLLNEVFIRLTIQPHGPLLVKAGDKGADPTLPDMEFVRMNGQPYLPGSSLKGVIRSHGERLARTVGGASLACDPLQEPCNREFQNRLSDTAKIYVRSCFVCRLFGNTSLASRFYITDAMPLDPQAVQMEERNGVAIDRVFGSVAVGPFNYETMTEGELEASLCVRNFSCAQLGLLALILRDIQQQRVRIGFGKSRGLGAVRLQVQSLLIRYPTCVLDNEQLRLLGGAQINDDRRVVAGIGAFPHADSYELSEHDTVSLPDGVPYRPNTWEEPEVLLEADEQIVAFWRACVQSWREEVNRWGNSQGT